MAEGITFNATLAAVRTMTDGGWRVTLDVPQTDAPSLLELAKLRDQILMMAAIPVTPSETPKASPWR